MPSRVVDGVELHGGVAGGRTVLVGHHVLAPPGHHGGSRPGQHPKGDLVGHGARRHEERGRLAHPCRERLLQRAHRGVLPVVVVTHHGLGHGAAHGGRGAGDGVTAQVDEVGHAATLTMRPIAFGGARPSSPMAPTTAGSSRAGGTTSTSCSTSRSSRPVPNKVVLRLPVTWKVHQPYGILHGGVSALLAESAASFGASLAAGRDRQVVGIELNASHLRSVRDGHLTGHRHPTAGRADRAGLVNRRDRRRRPGHLRRPLHPGRARRTGRGRPGRWAPPESIE